jgi:hypothetical protein
MKLHANAPLGPKGRERIVLRVIEQGQSLAAAAEVAGVSQLRIERGRSPAAAIIERSAGQGGPLPRTAVAASDPRPLGAARNRAGGPGTAAARCACFRRYERSRLPAGCEHVRTAPDARHARGAGAPYRWVVERSA